MNWRTPGTILAASFVALCCCGTAMAQSNGIHEGKPLPRIAATAASGRWLERAPLNAATYGKVGGVIPAISKEPKIVIYTSALSEDFFKIAEAVDKYVAEHPGLEWSFVQVKDAKGAQFGGYTADELRARLDEIKALAKKHNITHLSFLVSAVGSHATEPDTSVILAHVRLPDKPDSFPVVDWVTEMPAASLQGKTLTAQLSAMNAAIQHSFS